jgi:hypothetical protein
LLPNGIVRPARTSAIPASIRSPGAGNAIEQSNNLFCVGVSVLDRLGQQRAGDRPLADVSARGDPSELLAGLGCERYIEANGFFGHAGGSTF